MSEAVIIDYAGALSVLRAVADANGCRVRRLEPRRHQLISPAGSVMCILAMRHGSPSFVCGQRAIHLRRHDQVTHSDAVRSVTRSIFRVG